MTKTLINERVGEKVGSGFEKPEGLELVIIPKKKSLDWYKYMS